MVTLVGTQKNFEDATIELVELEYDAIGAYKLATEKLENKVYKDKLSEFLADHEKHLVDLKKFLHDKCIKCPEKGDFSKGILAKLKVAIGNLTNSDLNILRAMLDNEEDTNTAYERMVNHKDKAQELELFLSAALNDEHKHKLWLETTLNNFI